MVGRYEARDVNGVRLGIVLNSEPSAVRRSVPGAAIVFVE